MIKFYLNGIPRIMHFIIKMTKETKEMQRDFYHVSEEQKCQTTSIFISYDMWLANWLWYANSLLMVHDEISI